MMNSLLNVFNQNGPTSASEVPAAGASGLSLLQCFEAPPGPEKPPTGVYELNAKFEYGYSADFDASLATKHCLPTCDQESDSLIDNIISSNSSAQVGAYDKQPLARRLLGVYHESGVLGVLEELQSPALARSTAFQVPQVAVSAARLIVRLVDFVHAPINPWLMAPTRPDEDQSAAQVERQSASVRLLQWHPRLNKYAVATASDIVKVYGRNCAPVVLKHQKQTNVTCLAWKPFYSSLLAIGCADRIIIWDTESLPISIKPASSCSFVLSRRYHRDITDLQWHPKADFLLSLASRDNQILIWDTTMRECVPVKRVGTVGFGLARFSPAGDRLFTADLSTSFRVWDPNSYASEKWTGLVARCSSACWSPDGSVLLFACHDCPLVYSLRFLSNNKQELQIACDLSETTLDSEEEPVKRETEASRTIGGAIKEICWDPTGQRLAVSFRSGPSRTSVIATFITKTHPRLQILPCGLITSWDGSFPASIGFKPAFADGALLTIAWSNSRVQHVPFYFDKLSQDDAAASSAAKKVSNITFLP